MKLHPATWAIFGLAAFGLVTLATIIIPLIVVAAIAMIMMRSKKVPSFHDLDNFVEVNNVHRVRAIDVRGDSRRDGQNAPQYPAKIARV